jgi:hypothetical protein
MSSWTVETRRMGQPAPVVNVASGAEQVIGQSVTLHEISLERTAGRMHRNSSSDYQEQTNVFSVSIFRDIAPCSPYVNRRFGGTYRLHLHSGFGTRASYRSVHIQIQIPPPEKPQVLNTVLL